MGACCYDTPYGYTAGGAFGPYGTTTYEATSTTVAPGGIGYSGAVVDPYGGGAYGTVPAYGAAPAYGVGATYL